MNFLTVTVSGAIPACWVFMWLPDWRRLAKSLLCCDLVGFQTYQDMNNFTSWLENEFRTERAGINTFRIMGRLVRTDVFPVGIDFDDVRSLTESNSCSFMEQQCREKLPAHTILSGGHLDDSAGLPYRISAVGVLLRRHGEYEKNITLLQLANPMSGYAYRVPDISHALETLCGEFNGVHGTMDWYPVSCLTQVYSREEQAGIYRASRVALVTPLLAGMSLMAKMYVALQEPDNPGVLILSQFAGAAEHMEGAIIVNPYDPDAIADAIHTALSMPVMERRSRYALLMKGLHMNTSYTWSEAFLSALDPLPEPADPVQPAAALSQPLSGRNRC